MNTNRNGTHSTTHRLATILSAIAFAVAAFGSTAVGQAAGSPAASKEYVPFVTDFPTPAANETTDKPFVPFVTDFPKRAASPASAASASGIDRGDVGIGSAVGAALAALLAGSWLLVARRPRPVQS